MSSTKTEPRLLFSFWDGGRGHLTRVMALASEARRRGYHIGFVVSKKYAREARSLAGANVYVIPNRPASTPPPPYEFPLYSHAYRHAQRLRGLGFDNVRWLQEVTELEIVAIKDFRPDAIVNDYRDTIRTAAQVCGVPVVGITHATGNVDGQPFGWWAPPPAGAHLPDCRESFNEVRALYGLPPIIDEREMFSGDVNIIPSIPALDPLAKPSNNSFYVGMLSRWKPEGARPRLIETSAARRRVFSYVGEASRPSYGYDEILSEVIEREPDLGFYVVGNPGNFIGGRIDSRVRKSSVIIDHFLPGPPLIQDSSAVLCHGGGGTVMLSLALGKPLICVGPYTSDNSSRFRGVELEGAGLMLNHDDGPLDYRSAPDLGEEVGIFGYWKTRLSADHLHRALQRVLEEPEFADNARRLGETLKALGGVERAVDICKEVASSAR